MQNVTQLCVKDKLVQRFAGRTFSEGSVLVYLVGTSVAFQILRTKFLRGKDVKPYILKGKMVNFHVG